MKRKRLRLVVPQPLPSVPIIDLQLEYFDFLGIDWHEIRLHGLFWDARQGAPVTFSGETYWPTTKEWPMDEIQYAILVNRKLARLHRGDGRLWPTHWILIDALNGKGFILPAEVARASVIEQRPVGWTPPELSFPFEDGGSEGG